MAKTQADSELREVVTGEIFGPPPPHPRRVYTLEEKRRLVEACRTLADEGALEAIHADEPVMPESDVKQLRSQAREMQRLLAEALVKTMHRDYVYWSRIDNAEAVLAQLARWIDDYNKVHRHKGLKMRSPREYRRVLSGGTL